MSAEWVKPTTASRPIDGHERNELVMVAGELPASTAGGDSDDGHAWLQGVHASLTRVGWTLPVTWGPNLASEASRRSCVWAR